MNSNAHSIIYSQNFLDLITTRAYEISKLWSTSSSALLNTN